MKIVCISDVHCKYRYIKDMPEGDIIVCAGDITYRGEMDVLKDFAEWFGKLPFKHKITIFGNHEIGLSQEGKRKVARQYFEDNGVTLLHDSSIIIDGIHFYGNPASPFFHNWEFNFHRGKDIAAEWRKIPNQTNVLITHGPPIGILDNAPRSGFDFEHVGCQDLLERIMELRHLKACVFGHIHHDGGKIEIHNDVKFVNASICNEAYNPINLPVLIEI